MVPRAGLAACDVSNSNWVVCEGSKEEATAFLSVFFVLLFSSVLHAPGASSELPNVVSLSLLPPRHP